MRFGVAERAERPAKGRDDLPEDLTEPNSAVRSAWSVLRSQGWTNQQLTTPASFRSKRNAPFCLLPIGFWGCPFLTHSHLLMHTCLLLAQLKC